MGMQEAQGACRNCGRNVLIRRQGTNHVLHLLLALITAGIWIPVWILCSIKIGGWRCSTCGGRVARKLEVADYAVLVLFGLIVLIVVAATSGDTDTSAPQSPSATRPKELIFAHNYGRARSPGALARAG